MDILDQGDPPVKRRLPFIAYRSSWSKQPQLPFFDGEDVGIYAGVGDKLYKIIGDDCTEVKDA